MSVSLHSLKFSIEKIHLERFTRSFPDGEKHLLEFLDVLHHLPKTQNTTFCWRSLSILYKNIGLFMSQFGDLLTYGSFPWIRARNSLFLSILYKNIGLYMSQFGDLVTYGSFPWIRARKSARLSVFTPQIRPHTLQPPQAWTRNLRTSAFLLALGWASISTVLSQGWFMLIWRWRKVDVEW